MSRYVLTDEAKQDLLDIRQYLREEAGVRVALAVVRKITEAFLFLSRTPGAGHSREDLTTDAVKFWSVYSYMIVYNPTSRPIEIVRMLHGARDLENILL